MGERRAFVRNPDGTEQDITEMIRILYDGVVHSLNWGSGWWSGEDAAIVGWFGLAFTWADATEAANFARELAKYQGFRQKLDAEIPAL